MSASLQSLIAETQDNFRSDPSSAKATFVSESALGEGFHSDVSIRDHRIAVDEPESLGGDDQGPTPMEYIFAGLASCKAITIRMYAERKKWSLDKVDVQVRYESVKDQQPTVHAELTIEGDLDSAQKARLIEIGDRCPVHRFLSQQIAIESKLV